jgi:hypothetical protein
MDPSTEVAEWRYLLAIYKVTIECCVTTGEGTHDRGLMQAHSLLMIK